MGWAAVSSRAAARHKDKTVHCPALRLMRSWGSDVSSYCLDLIRACISSFQARVSMDLENKIICLTLPKIFTLSKLSQPCQGRVFSYIRGVKCMILILAVFLGYLLGKIKMQQLPVARGEGSLVLE